MLSMIYWMQPGIGLNDPRQTENQADRKWSRLIIGNVFVGYQSKKMEIVRSVSVIDKCLPARNAALNNWEQDERMMKQ